MHHGVRAHDKIVAEWRHQYRLVLAHPVLLWQLFGHTLQKVRDGLVLALEGRHEPGWLVGKLGVRVAKCLDEFRLPDALYLVAVIVTWRSDNEVQVGTTPWSRTGTKHTGKMPSAFGREHDDIDVVIKFRLEDGADLKENITRARMKLNR